MFREPDKLGVVTLYSVLALLSKETGVMVLPILAAWTWNPRRPAKQALPLLAKYALVVSQYTALNSIDKQRSFVINLWTSVPNSTCLIVFKRLVSIVS